MGGVSTKIVITPNLVVGLVSGGTVNLVKGRNTVTFRTKQKDVNYEVMAQCYNSFTTVAWEVTAKRVDSFDVDVDEDCVFIYIPISN